MRESINPNVRRQRLRHAHRELVIDDGRRRHELRVKDHHFHISLSIRNDSDFRRLATRTGRRRHSNHGRPGIRNPVISLKPAERFAIR